MMARIIRVAVVLAIGTGLFLADRDGWFENIEAGYRSWLGAGAAQWKPAQVTVIQTERADGAGRISGMDAALFFRAVLRHQPQQVIVNAPIAVGDDAPLVAGVLDRMRQPATQILFCSGPEAARLEGVSLKTPMRADSGAAGYIPQGFAGAAASAVARSGGGWKIRTVTSGEETAVATVMLSALLQREEVTAGSVQGVVPGLLALGGDRVIPVGAEGMTFVRSPAEKSVATATLEDVLLMTEQSEKGVLSAILPNLLSNRTVVFAAGEDGMEFARAAGGLLGGLMFRHMPPALGIALLAVVALLAWGWGNRVATSVLLAIALLGVWLMQALAWIGEFQTILPLVFPAGLLAVFVGVCRIVRRRERA